MNALPIAATTVPAPVAQKNGTTQSSITEKTDFHQALRVATSGLSVPHPSADAKVAAQETSSTDIPSTSVPIAAPEEKPSTNSPMLAAIASNVVPAETTEGTADLAVTPATLSSAASKSATPKSTKGVHPESDSSRAGKVTAALPENSQQLAVSTQIAVSTPAEIVVPALGIGASSVLAQQQAETFAPSVTSLSPQREAALDTNDVVTASAATATASSALLMPIAKSMRNVPDAPASSIATSLAQPSAATEKTGARTAVHGNAATHATRGVAAETTRTATSEQPATHSSTHSETYPPDTASKTSLAAGPSVSHSETKSVTPQASHARQTRQDAAATPATSSEKDARTTSPDHDDDTSLEAIAHATLAQAATTVQTTSPQMTATPTSQAAALQSAPTLPAVVPNTLPGSAAPRATAQASEQSPPTVEQPHTIDAQLRVQANQSELKVSVQLPELGKVEVRAVSTHDATTAHVTASRHDAVPLLAAERSGLEEALRSHNVILGSVGSQSQGNANPQQRQQSSHTPAQSSTAPETATASTTAETPYPGFLPDHASISVRA